MNFIPEGSSLIARVEIGRVNFGASIDGISDARSADPATAAEVELAAIADTSAFLGLSLEWANSTHAAFDKAETEEL